MRNPDHCAANLLTLITMLVTEVDRELVQAIDEDENSEAKSC